MFFKHEEEEPIAILTCHSGDFELTKRVTTIGRSKSNDIVLPSPNVSLKHAKIYYDIRHNVFYIEVEPDCEIIYLGKIQHQGRYIISDTEKICIGGIEFTFHPILAIIVGFDGKHHVLPRNRPITIGRAGDIKTPSHFKGVSRIHAMIKYDKKGRRYVIQDNSTNGTFINQKRVKSKVLEDNDNIMFRIPGDELPSGLTFRYLHYEGDKEIKVKGLSHQPDIRAEIEALGEQAFSDFNQTVIALLDKIGFVRGGEKWRDFEKQPRWVHYGKGHPMNICSEQAQPSWHIDRFCQRCFKIFIHPNKEGFFEVLVTVLQILDRHFDHFEGKIMSQSSPAHIPMRSNRKGPWDNHDRIIVYSMATPEDKDKSLGHFYNKASHVINKLKSGLAHLEQYAETSGRPPYTKQVTNLIFVRQGGGYHRVKGDGYKDEELTPKYPMQFEGNHWEFIKPDLPQSGK